MLQRNGIDRHRAVLHHQPIRRRIHRIEPDRERQPLAKEAQERVHILTHRRRPVDPQLSVPPQHTQRRDQSRQPKAMVAMQMGNKHMVQAGELNTHPPHLQLRPLAAINHIQFIAQINDLRRGQMPRRGQSRTASQDMYREICHHIF